MPGVLEGDPDRIQGAIPQQLQEGELEGGIEGGVEGGGGRRDGHRGVDRPGGGATVAAQSNVGPVHFPPAEDLQALEVLGWHVEVAALACLSLVKYLPVFNCTAGFR